MAMRGRRVARAMVQESWLTGRGAPKKDRRGGKRKGAGRPPKGERAGSPHTRRPAIKASTPGHVVLRVAKAVGNLRRRDLYRALRTATLTVAKHEDVRIVHVSIQRNHVHLLVEAKDKRALARGMQSFQISAAKLINAQLVLENGERRRGSVFPDRYHLEVITNRRQARHALAYVLNNWRKHGEHRDPDLRGCQVDPFSTGARFTGWRGTPRSPEPLDEPLVVWEPRTWLLTDGWRLYGLVSPYEVPSSTERRRRVDRAVTAQLRSIGAIA